MLLDRYLATVIHGPDLGRCRFTVFTGTQGVLSPMLTGAGAGLAGSVRGDDDRAAIDRFRATGEAYIRFAVEQPHLFRRILAPDCTPDHGKAPAHLGAESVSYTVLCRCLEDLEMRGLLRPGVRLGLDLVAWTMVHGFASLVLDGGQSTDGRDEECPRAKACGAHREVLPVGSR